MLQNFRILEHRTLDETNQDKYSKPTELEILMSYVLKKGVKPATIDSLPAGEKERLVADATRPNLYLVISPKGRKSWRWQSAIIDAGKRKSVKRTLGKWPVLSVDEARAMADQLNDRREAGAPLVEPKREPIDQDSASLKTFAERWLEDKRRDGRGLKTLAEYERLLKSWVYPVCGSKAVEELDRGDMDAVINPLRDRGVGVLSNRVLATIRPIVRLAVARDRLAKDITAHIAKFNEARVKKNQRALSIDEMADLWLASDQMEADERDALRLLILTGTRRNEALAARVEDWADGVWTIQPAQHTDERGHTFPVSHAKNDRAHPLTLGPVGRKMLNDRRKGRKFFFADSVHKFMMPDILKNARAAAGQMEEFDLRSIRRGVRTAITSDEMRAAGHLFGEEDGERLLNHALGTLNATYNKGDYAGRIGEMLAAWESVLMARVAAKSNG